MYRSSLAALLVATVLLVGCAETIEAEAIPEEYWGSYVTDDERFVGRSFTLEESSLVIDNGRHADWFSVLRVERGHEERFDMVTLFYLSADGQEYEFSFYPASVRRALHMRGRPDVLWTRVVAVEPEPEELDPPAEQLAEEPVEQPGAESHEQAQVEPAAATPPSSNPTGSLPSHEAPEPGTQPGQPGQ